MKRPGILTSRSNRGRNVGGDFWGKQNLPLQHDEALVSDGVQKIPLAHGSFDNDVEVMTRTLKRILGKNLPYPIENLKGY
ncbi:MAG: hypothetical protein R3B74_05480 [Nitrospirales bacterium]|nr:hypothetical protein [Nitrospirales bacterium]